MALTVESAYNRLTSLKDGMSHAYLFYGISTVELFNLAEKIAKFLLCGKDPQKHPDFLKILPEGRSRTISVDSIRGVEARLSQHSHEGGAKVILIHEGDRMGVQAANALLKTLEEPPGRSHIFITCVSQENLLPTILSRCVLVPLSEENSNKLAPIQDSAIALFRKLLADTGKPHTTKSLMLAEGIGELAEAEASAAVKAETAIIKKLKKEGEPYLVKEREEILAGMLAAQSKLQTYLAVSGISRHLTNAYALLLKNQGEDNGYFYETLSGISKTCRGIDTGANRKLLLEALCHKMLLVQDKTRKEILNYPPSSNVAHPHSYLID